MFPSWGRAQARGTARSTARAPTGPGRPSPAPAQAGPRERAGARPPARGPRALRAAGGARGGPPAGLLVPGTSAGAKKSPRGGAAAGPARSWMHFKSTFRNTPARAGAQERAALLTWWASSLPAAGAGGSGRAPRGAAAGSCVGPRGCSRRGREGARASVGPWLRSSARPSRAGTWPRAGGRPSRDVLAGPVAPRGREGPGLLRGREQGRRRGVVGASRALLRRGGSGRC